jgi:exodeoxyribonuclease-3
VNIAHQAIDLKNWKGNLKNSGFLPEERARMSTLLGHDVDVANAAADELNAGAAQPGTALGAGLVDVYRRLQPTAAEEAYTWWSNRGQAWAKNVGWRIDYHLATPTLAALARSEAVYKAERFSDHAPLTVEYQLAL